MMTERREQNFSENERLEIVFFKYFSPSVS
jgi:hypothetical protein